MRLLAFTRFGTPRAGRPMAICGSLEAWELPPSLTSLRLARCYGLSAAVERVVWPSALTHLDLSRCKHISGLGGGVPVTVSPLAARSLAWILAEVLVVPADACSAVMPPNAAIRYRVRLCFWGKASRPQHISCRLYSQRQLAGSALHIERKRTFRLGRGYRHAAASTIAYPLGPCQHLRVRSVAPRFECAQHHSCGG